MNESTVALAILATWVLTLAPGCVNTGKEDATVDHRANSPIPLNAPIENPSFDFKTPQLAEHHVITEADFKKITKHMSLAQVEAILGRKPDMGEFPGISFGPAIYYWFEDNATVTICFAPRGGIDRLRFAKTALNETPDFIRDLQAGKSPD